MEKKNYIFVTDINYLIRLLQEDIDRYSRLLNAVSLLGKFDKKIKLTVNHDYKDTNLVYAVDKDNKVFALYDNCERDMKKRYTLYVRDRDIVKKYSFKYKINEEKIGYCFGSSHILWVSFNEMNLELPGDIFYNLKVSNKFNAKIVARILDELKVKDEISFEDFSNVILSVNSFDNLGKITLSKSENDILLHEQKYCNGILTEEYIREIKKNVLKKGIS